jgi:hypothetical protein
VINRTDFLSNLNRALKMIEKESIERATVCLEMAKKKLKDKDPFSTGYEVEARVEYYINDDDDPAHTFVDSFHYEQTVIDKDYMVLDNGNGTDWHREGYMPLLDEPYCYLLHDLMDHSHLNDKIYGIERIWVDLIYRDQKGIKKNEDGSWRGLVLCEEGGYE